jgi:hypothetical protein
VTTPSEPPVEPPREVKFATWLWYATAALILVTSVILFTGRETAAQQARQTRVEGLTPDEVYSASITAAVVLSLVGLVLGALVAFAATKLAGATTWARIFLTVTGILIIVFNMIGFSTLGLLTAFTAFGGVLVMYLKPVQDFFAAAKQAR